MDLSIIIASSRTELMKECLIGFAQQAGSCKFEVIVAGNISGLNACAENVKLIAVQQTHPNVRRNRAVAEAKSDLIALLDDDAVPDKNWVSTAVNFSRQHEQCVLTGPELPNSSANGFSQLSHRLLASAFSEFSKSHANIKLEKVRWFESPFCNCVFPQKLWKQSNGFNENIPWHMDDFHFFSQFRNTVIFLNVPQLIIRHHRYPGSLTRLIKYKWRLRKETGEKLFRFPAIYWAVIPVRAAVILSFLSFILFFALLFTGSGMAFIPVSAYFLLVFAVVTQRTGFAIPLNLLKGIAVISAVHFVSAAALYYGLISAFVHSCLEKRTY